MNAIPQPIQALLDVFSTALADVRFADVDAQALARSASDVEAAADVVATAQSALDAARQALDERQDALFVQAQRALAYARVYAETDEALSTQLDAVSLPRAVRRSRADEALVLSAEPQSSPRPRGRPRKVPVLVEPELEPALAPAE